MMWPRGATSVGLKTPLKVHGNLKKKGAELLRCELLSYIWPEYLIWFFSGLNRER